jgi:intraflagellar transport protein 172
LPRGRYYVTANATKAAIAMYNNVGKWEDAHRLASTCMQQEEVSTLYITQAQDLESKGRYKEAEK